MARKALAQERIGMVRRMNCGLLCEIIEYRDAKDIVVRFEKGSL